MGGNRWKGITVADRLDARVDHSGECWVVIRGLQGRGYGMVRFEGKCQLAHRVAWQLENGPIPAGLFVLHRCDNRACVRVAHLFLGTAKDNSQDTARKGRFSPISLRNLTYRFPKNDHAVDRRRQGRAHRAVASATRRGELIRQPCVKCGRTAHAHHDDYDRPLDVVWLCRKHHFDVHVA